MKYKCPYVYHLAWKATIRINLINFDVFSWVWIDYTSKIKYKWTNVFIDQKRMGYAFWYINIIYGTIEKMSFALNSRNRFEKFERNGQRLFTN